MRVRAAAGGVRAALWRTHSHTHTQREGAIFALALAAAAAQAGKTRSGHSVRRPRRPRAEPAPISSGASLSPCAPRLTKWGRRRERACGAFRAHVAASGLRAEPALPPALASARDRRRPPELRAPARESPQLAGARATRPRRGGSGGGGPRAPRRSGFCPSSLFTRRNFRPDVFSQGRNTSRGQSDRKRSRRRRPSPGARAGAPRLLPAPGEVCCKEDFFFFLSNWENFRCRAIFFFF